MLPQGRGLRVGDSDLARIVVQLNIGPKHDAGELVTIASTEGASLPANLSGTRTASNWPLWKARWSRYIAPEPPSVKGTL